MGNRRQLPRSRGRRPNVGVDMDVDDAGAAILDSLLHCGRQILATSHRNAVRAASASPYGEVGVVALAARALLSLVETGADFPSAEQAILQVANCAPGEVVPYDPHAGQLVLDSRRHHEIGRAHV